MLQFLPLQVTLSSRSQDVLQAAELVGGIDTLCQTTNLGWSWSSSKRDVM